MSTCPSLLPWPQDAMWIATASSTSKQCMFYTLQHGVSKQKIFLCCEAIRGKEAEFTTACTLLVEYIYTGTAALIHISRLHITRYLQHIKVLDFIVQAGLQGLNFSESHVRNVASGMKHSELRSIRDSKLIVMNFDEFYSIRGQGNPLSPIQLL